MQRSERWAIATAAGVALLAALAGIDARATYGARVTADEPQYLLTAQSLIDDGDLDISDEIEDEDYLAYHEIPIDRQTAVLDDGREVSPHDPLLPALLALPMALGGWALAKVTVALFAAFAAGTSAWTAMRRFRVRPTTAAVTVGSAFAGLPLAGYGTQVYPEMPAAAITVAAFAVLAGSTLRARRVGVVTLAIVALPWLAVKYAPVAVVLAAALLVRSDSRRTRGAIVGLLSVAGVAYLLAHRAWYGGWTVYAAGDHFERTGEFSVVGTDVDLLGRSRRIVGLIVDRDFGLAAWSPLWLFLPAAAAWIVRRRPDGWALWVALVAAGWLNATFVALTMHGWWVPGRQVVVVLPVAAVGLAAALDRCRTLWPAVTLGALGAANWIWLAVEASIGRRTLVVDFADTAAVPYRSWRRVLPSGVADRTSDVVLLIAWTIALSATATLTYRRATRD